MARRRVRRPAQLAVLTAKAGRARITRPITMDRSRWSNHHGDRDDGDHVGFFAVSRARLSRAGRSEQAIKSRCSTPTHNLIYPGNPRYTAPRSIRFHSSEWILPSALPSEV